MNRLITELLEAVALARNHLDESSIIRAWCEIAKILGISIPEIKNIEITAESGALRAI